jgi:tetratricopeptide (TPR) repeat protein
MATRGASSGEADPLSVDPDGVVHPPTQGGRSATDHTGRGPPSDRPHRPVAGRRAGPRRRRGGPALKRAAAALAAHDLPAFEACVAGADALEDPRRRYVARRTLVELGLQARPDGGTPKDAAVLLASARVGVAALEAAPAEPTILNLTGVALYELGALRAAEAVFRAARSLDPELDHVGDNLRALKRSRKAGTRIAVPPPVARELPALERRAAAVASRAKPGPVEKISLCMIVRDEEAVLDRCLASVAGAVDEIIVVDTGSTDATKAIAERHGARVVDHAWTNDFAAARNVGVEEATGDWILFLDADEVLDPAERPRLRELTRRTWREAFRITIHNQVGTGDERRFVISENLRIFRNRPDYRFVGRVHESVAPRLHGDALERMELVELRVDHDGYLAVTRAAKDKTRRNMELLEAQLAEEGESHFLLFNLGSEYAATGDVARAVDHLSRAWRHLLDDPGHADQPFAPSLAVRYVTALRNAGRFQEATEVAEHALNLFEGFTDIVLEQAHIARQTGDVARAEALLRRCLELGEAPSRYVRVVGSGTFIAATYLAGVLLTRGEPPRPRPSCSTRWPSTPTRSRRSSRWCGPCSAAARTPTRPLRRSWRARAS